MLTRNHYTFGSFEFLSILFGLQNATNTFQRFIDEVVCDLDFVYAYINDFIIATSTYCILFIWPNL